MQLLSAGLPPRTGHAAAAQIMAGAHPPEGAPVTALTMGDTLQHASTAFSLTYSVVLGHRQHGYSTGHRTIVSLANCCVLFELLTLNCCYLLSDSF